MQEYQSIMDESPNGVVLVSFGSIAQSATMPTAIKQSFYKAFAAFPEVNLPYFTISAK